MTKENIDKIVQKLKVAAAEEGRAQLLADLTFAAEEFGNQCKDSALARTTLVPLLYSPDVVVREGALIGIQGHIDNNVALLLADMVRNDPSPTIRDCAAQTLDYHSSVLLSEELVNKINHLPPKNEEIKVIQMKPPNMLFFTDEHVVLCLAPNRPDNKTANKGLSLLSGEKSLMRLEVFAPPTSVGRADCVYVEEDWSKDYYRNAYTGIVPDKKVVVIPRSAVVAWGYKPLTAGPND